MDPIQVIPILISTFAFFLSGYAAYRTGKFNDIALRRSSRETHIKMLFDIRKMLVDSPSLWAIYDAHPLSAEKDLSALGVAKREAFIFQHLNVFELVFDYYNNLIKQDDIDRAYWRAWDSSIRQLFHGSSEARLLFSAARTREIYSKDFASYIVEHIGKAPAETQSTKTTV
jgi:hypothetical protein